MQSGVAAAMAKAAYLKAMKNGEIFEMSALAETSSWLSEKKKMAASLSKIRL